jgi:hypothetical protein
LQEHRFNPSKALALFDLLGGVIKGVILNFLFILGFCLEERCALEFREVIAEFLRGKKLAHFSNERGQFGGELRPLFRSPCKRQKHDLLAYAARAGYEIVGVWKESASGVKLDRAERKKVMALAQARKIDAILVVTELSRWGCSTIELAHTLQALQAWNVSLTAQAGLQFDLATPQGKMMCLPLIVD